MKLSKQEQYESIREHIRNWSGDICVCDWLRLRSDCISESIDITQRQIPRITKEGVKVTKIGIKRAMTELGYFDNL